MGQMNAFDTLGPQYGVAKAVVVTMNNNVKVGVVTLIVVTPKPLVYLDHLYKYTEHSFCHVSENVKGNDAILSISNALLFANTKKSYVTILYQGEVTGPSLGMAVFAAARGLPYGPILTGSAVKTGFNPVSDIGVKKASAYQAKSYLICPPFIIKPVNIPSTSALMNNYLSDSRGAASEIIGNIGDMSAVMPLGLAFASSPAAVELLVIKSIKFLETLSGISIGEVGRKASKMYVTLSQGEETAKELFKKKDNRREITEQMEVARKKIEVARRERAEALTFISAGRALAITKDGRETAVVSIKQNGVTLPAPDVKYTEVKVPEYVMKKAPAKSPDLFQLATNVDINGEPKYTVVLIPEIKMLDKPLTKKSNAVDRSTKIKNIRQTINWDDM